MGKRVALESQSQKDGIMKKTRLTIASFKYGRESGPKECLRLLEVKKAKE